MSEIEPQFVHQGIWVDVSRGSFMGRTITTDARTGTFLIAVMAVLCSLATGHLWHLITFGIHQYRADGSPKDALFRQQQAILRTFPTPSAVMTEHAKLYMSWRKAKTHSPMKRTISITVFAAVFSCATVLAGIFSSYVVDTTNILVNVNSPFCATYFDTLTEGFISSFSPLVQSLAAPLVEECYMGSDVSSAQCRIYSKPRVPFNVTRGDCPWNSSLCLPMDRPAVTMDSGLLDMNEAFGLNLAANDRVLYRKKTSCAILPVENHTSVVPAGAFSGFTRTPLPEEELLLFHYGYFPGNDVWRNTTSHCSLVYSNVTTDHFDFKWFGIYTDPYWAKHEGSLQPLPEMARQDSDIILKTIIKGYVAYWQSVDDPLFSAHKQRSEFNALLGENGTYYESDFPASVIGCAQQYQFCLAENNCTNLSYLPAKVTTNNTFPNASSLQLAVLQLLVTFSFLFDIQTDKSARAERLIQRGGYIDSLPSDQWVTEIVGWESHAWASLQIAIEKYSTGAKSIDPKADSYVRKPKTEGELALCRAQRMRKSGGFVNINVFGLSFICAVSLTLVLVDILLLRLLIYLSSFRRMRRVGPRIERWIQDGILQLQRRAYESTRQGTWSRPDKEVPITIKREALKDFSDV